MIGEPRAVHELQHCGGIALDFRKTRKDGNPTLGVMEGYNPALCIVPQTGVGRAFPTDTAGSTPDVV